MRYIVFLENNIRIFQDVRRMTWHAGPRGRPVMRRVRTRGTHGLRGSGTPEPTGPTGKRPDRPRSGGSRLIAFVCGRRSKYVVVAFWILVVAALGGLAGKLQGAEKNDASAYLPSSAESTQELNEQNLFQSKNLNPALVVYVRDSGVTAADLQKAKADARYFASLGPVNGTGRPAGGVQGPQGDPDRRRRGPRLQQRHRRLRLEREERRQQGQRRAEGVRRRTGGERGRPDQDLQGHRLPPCCTPPWPW